MNTSISQFLEILADNDYKPLYKDIPEDNPNRDEIIAEIQDVLDDDGHLPDELRYFELNGKTNDKRLVEFLIKNFKQFKIEFLAGKHGDNDSFKTELHQQLDIIKKDIEQKIYEASQLRDESLIEMLNAKSRICNEASEFIICTKVNSNQSMPKKKSQERRSYNWLKKEELLQGFYDKLKSNQLIAADTDINDFKAIFSNVPVSDINKPVQWEQGAKLFAYFFHKLITNNYIPQRPTWVNLSYCFTYNRGDIGKYVPMDEGVKSHVTIILKEGAPKGAELVDALFLIVSDQGKT